MSREKLIIGLVRRGYSPSGGAEAYLKRLGRGLADLGHEARLFATNDWPSEEWSFGEVTRVRARSAAGFADEIEKRRDQSNCDVLMSLERIWRCDVYRAGDGLHRSWLDRRKKFETPAQRLAHCFNRKHKEILRLEQYLLGERGAERVIANSKMVKDEIFDLYSYRPDRIDIVRNGIPLDHFRVDSGSARKITRRTAARWRSRRGALCRIGLGTKGTSLRHQSGRIVRQTRDAITRCRPWRRAPV